MNISEIAAPDEDTRFMAAALALGRRSLGICAPNPAVGALVVKEGRILGRGWTGAGGRPHAETGALREAGEGARGATVYVTLEPCSHHGETPPCAEAIVAAGVVRVVYAVGDPDPRVAGSGDAILAQGGVEVTKGVMEAQAFRANLGHMLRIRANRPIVTLKLALTADLYAAGSLHDARLVITGAAANGLVHMMRATHDAVMVGVGTIAADDSLLSVRLPGLEARRPLRVVIDSGLRLRTGSFLVSTATDYPTLVIAGEGAPEQAAERLRGKGVEVAFVRREGQSQGRGQGAGQGEGRVDLRAALELLAARGVTRVFSEGGPALAAALIRQGLADEVNLLTSPKPLGREGVLGLAPATAALLADPARYRRAEARMVGADSLARYERVL